DRSAVVGSGAGGTAALGTKMPSGVDGVVALGASPVFEDLDVTEQASKLEADALILDPPEGAGAELEKIVPNAELKRIGASEQPEVEEQVLSSIVSFLEQTIGKP
ncbi:MAG: hypothetical protein WD826_04015, partial [Actinomycetota bacterium]